MTITPPPFPGTARYQPSAPQPAQRPSASGATVVLTVFAWLGWVGVTLMADFMAFMMFAFADSPGAGKAAQAMIAPVFIWFAIAFVAGIILLIFRKWWTILAAFGLAISPPFVVFAGYNLLMGAPSRSTTPTTILPPAQNMTVPQGGFKPTFTTPQQPDFQKLIDETTRPTTQPMR